MRWQIHTIGNFASHASTWDALNVRAGSLPFLRTDFLIPALAEFGNGKEYLAIGEENGDPVAIGIFRRTRRGFWETFQPSQLPLGAFLALPGLPLESALGDLLRALPGVALGIALTQQDPAILKRPLDSATTETLDYVDTACVRIIGTFEDYWAKRGKNLRQNIKKQHSKLAADGVATSLESIERPEDVAAAIAQYGRLESAGWKSMNGTAISADNAQGRFYGKAFESFCAKGQGRIYSYLLDGRVVAMDLCLEGESTIVILKTTYDESYKAFSPAFLMRHQYFQPIFELGRIKQVEFYGKVMEWHLRWTDEVRTLFHVNRYRWPWVKTARQNLNRSRSTSEPSKDHLATDPTES